MSNSGAYLRALHTEISGQAATVDTDFSPPRGRLLLAESARISVPHAEASKQHKRATQWGYSSVVEQSAAVR